MKAGRHQAKIVVTLGPASSGEDRLEALMSAGADVFRLNFSHGTHQEHADTFHRIRKVAERLNVVVAVLADLQGPKIRTGPLQQEQPVELRKGDSFTITTRPVEGDAQEVSTGFQDLPRYAVIGQRLLLDDGNLELCVSAVSETDVTCEVVHGGPLGEHKGINLPGILVDIPALTEKDREDLELGLELGVDYIALSFVQRGEDVQPVREVLHAHHANVPVIAKIEKRQALQNLEAILQAFDGVMVARGDLGVEASPEEVPIWQKRIIQRANAVEKPVITATQMLETMVDNPRPTRAEASDVANAVWDGTDAVMLSAETAIGHYPVEAVATMARIIHEAETGRWPGRTWEPHFRTHAHAISNAACNLTRELHVAALVVFTSSGRTAQLASKARPETPILALTDDPAVCRRLALWWGVHPVLFPFRRTLEAMTSWMEEYVLEQGAVEPGDSVVLVGSIPVTVRGQTNFVKLHRIRQRKS